MYLPYAYEPLDLDGLGYRDAVAWQHRCVDALLPRTHAYHPLRYLGYLWSTEGVSWLRRLLFLAQK